ncbi:MAG: dTMP kinase [bacterium]|nr:dTMP kinase [bacterium]
MAKKGLLITFEGGDGVGKTTQVQLLCDFLQKQGKKSKIVHAVSGTRIGGKIRDILLDNGNKEMQTLTEVLLFQAARAQLYREVIAPGVEKGEIILMDRGPDSSVVYQGVARGIGTTLIKKLNKISTEGIQPDVTFLLDAPAKVGLQRIQKVEELDRLEEAGLKFHQQVRQAYLKLYRADGGKRMIKIDATRSVEEVHQQVITKLEQL